MGPFDARPFGNFLRFLLVCGSVFLSIGPATGAEMPFEKTAEFPASAYGIMAAKRVIWFGEMHGTHEAPELCWGLVRLVCSHTAAKTVVALEIPTTEQPAIDRYLASGNEAFLRSIAFFNSKLKDGRSSAAMVQLLSRLRTEKKATVFCFDSAIAATPQARDTAMARNLLLCAKKYPDAKLVVLSGNVHARVKAGTSWDPTYRPAAYELSRQLDSVVSFHLVYESGTIYALMSNGFGKHKVKGDRWTGTAPHYITLYPQRTGGYDGAIFARTLTASPPW